MWIDFMREALDGLPAHAMERPPGIVDVRINPETGLLAPTRREGTIFEKFRMDHVPDAEQARPEVPLGPMLGDTEPNRGAPASPGQIF